MATPKTSRTGKTGTTSKKLHAAAPRATAKKATSYAIPGAAVLGTGILAAAGFLMRDQLGHILLSTARSVVSGGLEARHAAAKELELGRILSHVGLQRRHTPVLGAGLGMLAGVAVGAALAMWLGPKVMHAFARQAPSVEDKNPSVIVRDEPPMDRRVMQDGAA